MYRGNWNAVTVYNRNDVVKFNEATYILRYLIGHQSDIAPDLDDNWEEYVNNVIYVQFPKSLSLNPAWEVQPNVSSRIYGFFELRVTEENASGFPQTWKPMRGLVELQYSPTEVVADMP